MNNPEFLQYVIMLMAQDAYENEVIQTDMEISEIGPGMDYSTKEEWIANHIETYFEEAKKKIVALKVNINIIQSKELTPMALALAEKFHSSQLGESFELDRFTTVVRVPGGWLYVSKDPQATSQTFVPLNTEFKSAMRIPSGPAQVPA